MIKKILTIFARDLKASTRNFIALYIIVVPLIFAVLINVFAPGINDTTANLALIKGENVKQIHYLGEFANLELLDSAEEVEARVMKRDDIVGILPEGDGYYVVTQGNEPEFVVDLAKTLMVLFENKASVEDSRAEIVDLGRDTPPMKRLFVNSAIMLFSVMGGMLIAINIIEEKGDDTISAVNVTTISRGGYIAGKSMIGVLIPVVSTVVTLLITGFRDINFGQAVVMVITSSIISILIGFIEGINNDDIINAAGNIKLLFLPLAGAVVAVELLSDKWQKLFYWIPFYWTYRGNQLVLSGTGSWSEILLYAGIVLGISAVVFAVLAPKIRKGLE